MSQLIHSFITDRLSYDNNINYFMDYIKISEIMFNQMYHN